MELSPQEQQERLTRLIELRLRLVKLSKEQRSAWTAISRAMIEVEREALWKLTTTSFTAWVRQLSGETHLHESNYWRALQAGRYWLCVHDTDDLDFLKKATAPAESIELVEKICRHAPAEVSNGLLERTVAGLLSRDDLRETWRTYRPLSGGRTARGRGTTGWEDIVPDNEALTAVVRSEMTQALRRYARDWLPQPLGRTHTLENVIIHTGAAHTPYPLDLVIATQPDPESPDDLSLWGVEIKCSPTELVEDKINDPLPFLDGFWVAVPAHLTDDALTVFSYRIGVLAIDGGIEGTVTRVRQTRYSQTHPSRRLALLTTLFRRTLNW